MSNAWNAINHLIAVNFLCLNQNNILIDKHPGSYSNWFDFLGFLRDFLSILILQNSAFVINNNNLYEKVRFFSRCTTT